MKNMIKDALILFAITLAAGLLLGVVNDVTKGPIAQAKLEAKQKAYREVFDVADRFEDYSIDENIAGAFTTETGYRPVDFNEVVKAYANDELVGYVLIVTEHEGYGGDIQFAVGLTLDGKLNGISLLSISETAGLGMEADKVLVPQFKNKDANLEEPVHFTYTKTGSTSPSEIDAIGGATITTKAILKGVNLAIDYFNEANLKEAK